MPWGTLLCSRAPSEGVFFIFLAWADGKFFFIWVHKDLYKICLRQLFDACSIYGYFVGIKCKGWFIGVGEEFSTHYLITLIAEGIVLDDL